MKLKITVMNNDILHVKGHHCKQVAHYRYCNILYYCIEITVIGKRGNDSKNAVRAPDVYHADWSREEPGRNHCQITERNHSGRWQG